jgi:SAM-dependent methyltransferase
MIGEREGSLGRLNSTEIKSYNKDYLVYYFLYESIQNAIGKYAKGSLLDIGCGNKPYAQWLNPYISKHLGCDIVQSSENSVDIICEANNIPLDDNSFDTVFCTQTIEHVGDYQKMVDEAYRLLKPGGYFIVSGPMYWPLHEEPYDFFRFTKYGFEKTLNNSGFECIEVNPNGGKWALFGQVIIQTLPNFFTFPKAFKSIHNLFFKYLDKKFYDPINTLNYVAIGRKK